MEFVECLTATENQPTFPSFNTQFKVAGGNEDRNDKTNHWVRTEDEWSNRHERSSYLWNTERFLSRGFSPFSISVSSKRLPISRFFGVRFWGARDPKDVKCTMLWWLCDHVYIFNIYVYTVYHDWWGLSLKKNRMPIRSLWIVGRCMAAASSVVRPQVMPDFDEPQFVKLAGGMGNLCVKSYGSHSFRSVQYRNNKGGFPNWRFIAKGMVATRVCKWLNTGGGKHPKFQLWNMDCLGLLDFCAFSAFKDFRLTLPPDLFLSTRWERQW